MKSFLSTLAILLAGFSLLATAPARDAILVFSKTAGFRHLSIPDGKRALLKLGKENNIRVDTTEDAAAFTAANLRQYKAIVFLSTSGDVFNDEQQTAFQEYIRRGGGFVGIHGASTTEYTWPWFNKLVGAYFLDHPKPQPASIDVWNKVHPATRVLPNRWNRFDEWYNYRDIQPGIKVLATMDEGSYQGGKHGRNHPIVWYHEFDGGRSFYTGFGHTPASYTEPLFLDHIREGILWAMGKKKIATN
ncbi:hypothetical protein GCM10027275_01770 [Rhabdobacter roseus]|uniref:Type 1 glutamine amidotransferase n=1 Tax=Rhabdobacter roseus TaxID=1655419 RepID=A0A840TKH6_9BACT|nr:ThuA domain-containing protein [Rhabdobacter roseus]MBB5282062.1 type 1 glutamine amidotransferase [Rhabdobacter roseus]